MASEVNRHGGVAICAAVAADDPIRKEVRAMIRNFIMVYLPTARNTKGFFNIPYDPPEDAEVVTKPDMTPSECVDAIIFYAKGRGLL